MAAARRNQGTVGEDCCARLDGVERAIALRRVDAFSSVPMEQLSYLAAVAVDDWYVDGAELIREGDPPGGLHVLLQGRVALERDGQAFGEATSGDAFGTWALFDDQPRRATVRALGPVHMLHIEREDFYDVLSEHVDITRSLVRDLVGQLGRLAGIGEADG